METCRSIPMLAILLSCATVANARLGQTARAQDEPGVFPNKNRDGVTTVIGALVRILPGTLVIDAGPAGVVSLPTARGTNIELSAPGTLDLIQVGAVVLINAKVNWNDFYNLGDPSITLFLEPPRKETRIQLTMRGYMQAAGDQVISFEPALAEKDRSWRLGSECYLKIYGIVLNTNPLILQCTSDTQKLVLADFTANKFGPLLINGAKFTVRTQEKQRIDLSLGTATQLLGERPAAEVLVLQSSNGARRDLEMPNGGPVSWVVRIRRTEPITAEDLKPIQKKTTKRRDLKPRK